MKMNHQKPVPQLSQFLIYTLLIAFTLPAPFFRAPFAMAEGKIKIIVKDFESRGVDDLLLETLNSLVKETVNRAGKYTIVTSEEGVDRVIVGTIDKVGDSYAIELKLLNGKNGQIINSYVEKVQEALADRVEVATGSVMLEVPPEKAGEVSKNSVSAEKNGEHDAPDSRKPLLKSNWWKWGLGILAIAAGVVLALGGGGPDHGPDPAPDTGQSSPKAVTITW